MTFHHFNPLTHINRKREDFAKRFPLFRCPKCASLVPCTHAQAGMIFYRCPCKLEAWTGLDHWGLVIFRPPFSFNRQYELTAVIPTDGDESAAGEAWKKA